MRLSPTLRPFARLLAVVLLLLSGPLGALTLGDLVVYSPRGAPLRAAVLLQLQPDEALASIAVRLADTPAYEAREQKRPAIAETLRFALLARGEGRARLELYSDAPWDGSDATLLLQLNWPQGELMQQYMLSWQPPATTPESLEVRADDTLDRIAIRLSQERNRSYLHMMYALYLANPDAFYRGNMNNLKSGVTLRIPSDEELNRLQNREVFAAIREQYRQWQQGGEGGGRASEAGEMLAGLTTAQAEQLDLGASPERLHGQLAQLAEENQAIAQENEQLRQRLARLEQQMAQVSERVLESHGAAAPEVKPSVPEVKPAAPPTRPVPAAVEEPPPEGISDTVLLLAMVLAAAAAYFIWRSARPGTGRRR